MSINVLGSACCPERSFIVRAANSALDTVKAINAEMQRRSNIRQGRKLLMTMPDHMLKDIGIGRSEIDFALRNGREIDRIRDRCRL